MADDKNVRFYAAKAAGAALLVNGIGYLRNDVSCVYVVPPPKCVQTDVTLPSLVQDESAQSTGAASVVAAVALLDFLHLVKQQRGIDELGPDIHDVHEFVRNLGKAPCLVSVGRAVPVVVKERVVKVDHAANEGSVEFPDASEIH